MRMQTFADFQAKDWPQQFPDEPDPGIDVQWAVYYDRAYRGMEHLLTDPMVVVEGAEAFVSELIAISMLEVIFDPGWVTKTFPLADDREPADGDRWILPAHQRRELARRVFEFQSYSWFPDFVKYTKENEVSSALFEADVIQTLMRMPGGVTRVTETGVKGQDFDALMNLGPAGRVPIEVKYKEDATPYSPETVRNTVRKAIQQYPKGETGWLFIHMPTTWIGRGLGEAYHEVLDDALRQTSRVGAVFTAVDKPVIDVTAGKIRHRRVWDFYLHPRAPERLREPSLLMAQLLDKEMDAFAPRAPF
ncbi:hypothetical protein [Streptomyces sp. NBC_00063]|uniref:hypothetical protein n=1 Tax=Streptomyces sp. NBC_00063 TaxID=2975638 RepID=UPI0022564DF3|nr:hypothetical protein [Streptomyces sp. NBC_00063]MCX5443876.1 hypothetical protein [Streptomyces sp. NBC_00063]